MGVCHADVLPGHHQICLHCSSLAWCHDVSSIAPHLASFQTIVPAFVAARCMVIIPARCSLHTIVELLKYRPEGAACTG